MLTDVQEEYHANKCLFLFADTKRATRTRIFWGGGKHENSRENHRLTRLRQTYSTLPLLHRPFCFHSILNFGYSMRYGWYWHRFNDVHTVLRSPSPNWTIVLLHSGHRRTTVAGRETSNPIALFLQECLLSGEVAQWKNKTKICTLPAVLATLLDAENQRLIVSGIFQSLRQSQIQPCTNNGWWN